jgi:hypothetical protein
MQLLGAVTPVDENLNFLRPFLPATHRYRDKPPVVDGFGDRDLAPRREMRVFCSIEILRMSSENIFSKHATLATYTSPPQPVAVLGSAVIVDASFSLFWKTLETLQ